MKRERWGKYILIRPEAAATWPRKDRAAWEEWDGHFRPSPEKKNLGTWHWKNPLPESWTINYRDLKFLIRPTSSKQVGLFPEQSCNWDWCRKKISAAQRPIKLLNLFGYTGAASIATVTAGAHVTHVDASKAMVAWCAENARSSTLDHHQEKLPIRLIVDDCLQFIIRELRRGNRYDAIILDPPTFGRGSSGELWCLEDHLYSLLQNCEQLLSEKPLFLLLNTYSPNLSITQLEKMLFTIFGKKEPHVISTKALNLQGIIDGSIIPCGLTTRWEANDKSIKKTGYR